jgi:hypothetical protein
MSPSVLVSFYLTFSPLPAYAKALAGKPALAKLQAGSYFLLRFYALTDIFPFGSMAAVVVRTFLSFH